MSKCGFCNNTGFALVDYTPIGAVYTQSFIQCAKCQAVVGVVDATNPVVLLEEIQAQLEAIKRRIGA
jgi:hypothetical protein